VSESSPGSKDKPVVNVDWDALRLAGPYPRQAFAFVQEGLGFTVRQVHGDPDKLPPGQRHVSGRQLCEGLRDYAIRKYGLLARSVLQHWHINRTEDFGKIVFAMIDAGLMSRTDRDTMTDFEAVYSFDEAFERDRIMHALSN